MKVLGIDPGLNISGYAIIDGESTNFKVLEAGILKTSEKLPMDKRLAELGSELGNLLEQFKPDVMAIEDLYSHYNHPRTAIIMGHARGLIFYKAAEAGIEVVPYASTRIKKSLTGNGRATKEQMQRGIQSRLNLSDIPEPPDVADALAVAYCHLQAANSLESILS
jgi:crossover junction endodeoxyribonuclease RuvC